MIALVAPTKCPECGEEKEFVIRNWDERFREGDVHCGKCGAYVRMTNAS